MKRLALLFLLVTVMSSVVHGERPNYLRPDSRIVFLGDSITAAGDFIALIEARLRLELGDDCPELINLGLPSETCTGLSEPDHPFPRPDVHERLGRVLEKARPDVVVACYGMNDGIYYPFDLGRFAQYKRGIQDLVQAIEASGAICILVSPPPFDPEPFRWQEKLRPRDAERFAWFAIYENYHQVIEEYARWLLSEESLGERRIDIHAPIREHLESGRLTDPGYALSNDGVHMNRGGHRLIAEAILMSWGLGQPREVSGELVDRCHARHQVLHRAWLTEVGHKRPGGKPGLPLAEANQKALEMEASIKDLLDRL